MAQEVELGVYSGAQKNYLRSISVTSSMLQEYDDWIGRKCRSYLVVLSEPLGGSPELDVPLNEAMLARCLYADLSARPAFAERLSEKLGTTDPGDVDRTIRALCNYIAFERWNEYAGEVLRK